MDAGLIEWNLIISIKYDGADGAHCLNACITTFETLNSQTLLIFDNIYLIPIILYAIMLT